MPTVPPLWAPHILVVDDSHDFADFLAQILGAWGFQPLVAYDGPSAVEAALSQGPDAILLDIALPGLDGDEVARRLRRHPGLEKTLLVAVTACVEYEDPRRALADGFDHLLLKPIDLKELRRLLAALA
jgi:CheY-like chemotaxis protein